MVWARAADDMMIKAAIRRIRMRSFMMGEFEWRRANGAVVRRVDRFGRIRPDGMPESLFIDPLHLSRDRKRFGIPHREAGVERAVTIRAGAESGPHASMQELCLGVRPLADSCPAGKAASAGGLFIFVLHRPQGNGVSLKSIGRPCPSIRLHDSPRTAIPRTDCRSQVREDRQAQPMEEPCECPGRRCSRPLRDGLHQSVHDVLASGCRRPLRACSSRRSGMFRPHCRWCRGPRRSATGKGITRFRPRPSCGNASPEWRGRAIGSIPITTGNRTGIVIEPLPIGGVPAPDSGIAVSIAWLQEEAAVPGTRPGPGAGRHPRTIMPPLPLRVCSLPLIFRVEHRRNEVICRSWSGHREENSSLDQAGAWMKTTSPDSAMRVSGLPDGPPDATFSPDCHE